MSGRTRASSQRACVNKQTNKQTNKQKTNLEFVSTLWTANLRTTAEKPTRGALNLAAPQKVASCFKKVNAQRKTRPIRTKWL